MSILLWDIFVIFSVHKTNRLHQLQKILKDILSRYSELLIFTTVIGLFNCIVCFSNSEYYSAWVRQIIYTLTHDDPPSVKTTQKRDSANALFVIYIYFMINVLVYCLFFESTGSIEQFWSDFHFAAIFTILTLIPQNELNNQPHP